MSTKNVQIPSLRANVGRDPTLSESALFHTTSSETALSKNALIANICRDESMHVDPKMFFDALQEDPIPLNGARASKEHYRPNGVNNQYKLIWDCAQLFFDKFCGSEKYFNIVESNRSCFRKKLCDWIYHGSRRNIMKRRNLTEQSHPNIWEYVKDLKPGAVVAVLDQKYLFEKAVAVWGVSDKSSRICVPSDVCRMIGVMLSPKIWDHSLESIGRKCINFDVDGTTVVNNYFNDVARAFNDVDVDIVHPEKWKEHCSMFVGFNEIDPNDTGRIMVQRSGSELEVMYQEVSSEYKKAMKVWTKSTGGRMRRDEIIQMGDGIGEERRFNDVALTQQKATSVPYLTWLYLADKQHGFSFLTFCEGRPANNGSTDDEDVLNSLCLLKYDEGATDFLEVKRSHSEIVSDLVLSRKLLDDAKDVYRSKKKRCTTKTEDLDVAKEVVKVYTANVDLLNMELSRSIGGKMIRAMENFDVSSESDSSL